MTATTTETELERHGIEPRAIVLRNPTTSQLYTDALKRGDGRPAEGGPLVVDIDASPAARPKTSSSCASRSPRSGSGGRDQPADRGGGYDGLRRKVVDYLSSRERLYVIDAYAGADPEHLARRAGRSPRARTTRSSPRRCLSGRARTSWSSTSRRRWCCMRQRLRRTWRRTEPEQAPPWCCTLTRGEVVIGGTFYAGEIKKPIFTLMNDRLPLEGVFPMHCSANVGLDEDVAIFFGLSGTGKTTPSADPSRSLIGDDEHGWGTNGVFNVEGGCYAKVIRLSPQAEPDIFRTTHTFGTILENVAMDERGIVDLDDDSKTENTRAAYLLEKIPNAHPSKMAGSQNVVFLTADAFGIPPPIARLTREQAQYWFLSGFTAKLAGTEIVVTSQPTFSTCFGAPFMPQFPALYARMLVEKLSGARRDGLARQHRLDRRAVRLRATGCRSRRPARCSPRRSPARSTAPSTARTTSSASRCRARSRAWTAVSSSRGPRGPIRL